jgi:glutathione S-transferase
VGARAEALPPLAPLAAWHDRVTALGHGSPGEMSPAEALDVAARATPAASDPTAGRDLWGIACGREVIVIADDTGRGPVRGRLLAVIGVENAQPGRVNIHLSRAGFDVVPARAAGLQPSSAGGSTAPVREVMRP